MDLRVRKNNFESIRITLTHQGSQGLSNSRRLHDGRAVNRTAHIRGWGLLDGLRLVLMMAARPTRRRCSRGSHRQGVEQGRGQHRRHHEFSKAVHGLSVRCISRAESHAQTPQTESQQPAKIP